MLSNLERYKNDLESLSATGKTLPSFRESYQEWYSESLSLIKQLLNDRLQDFIRHYQKPQGRKEITNENYRIEDCLQGLMRKDRFEQVVVDRSAAVPHFQQQLAILDSVKRRFESSLFDIRQLVQADVFDSELDAAEELGRKKFTRAAGAVAGVVLERHLAQVCDNHDVKVAKKAPGISDFNDALKTGNVLDTAQWRFIQHLGDLRNLCDHNKAAEPTKEQVDDLIAGVKKISKTLF
jgi:hypothetical protein